MKSSWHPAYTSLYARFVTRLAEEINFRNFIAHVLRPSKPIFRDFQNSPQHGPEQLAAAAREESHTTFYSPGRCLITSRLGLPSSLADLLITALNTAGGRGLLQEAGLASDGMEAMSYRTARQNQHTWWPVPCPRTYPPSLSPPAKRPQTFRQSGNSKFSWLTTFMKASGFTAFSCLMASSEFAGACIENRIAINSHILCLCKRLLVLNIVMNVCFYLVIMG